MASKDLTTKIILKGMTDPSLARAFKNANQLADNHMDKLQKLGTATVNIMKGVAVGTAAGLAYSTKAAIDYESAFAGVMKTVDETATTSYEDLSNSIRQMSKEMPASANEIAAVAEVAGQLGIKADDIANFSKVMINLGETTNLSSEDAASAIAKFFNITQTGMGDVDEFGATLVALGNNAATTESDILNMASRIASSGSMIGLSNQEILALATSLSSVGLEAEGGGTAISTVLSQIDKDVATNSKTLETWARLAGMSAGEFKTAWQTDTMGTIQSVVSGMGDAHKGGENLNLILEDLGITGIRTSDTMKRLTNASGLMSDMTKLANSEWNKNTALSDEANKRYATMASKIQILKNKLTDAAITIGNKLMPFVDKLISAISSVDWEGVATKIANGLQWICDHSTTILAILGAIAGAWAGIKIAGIIKGIITVVKVIKSLSSVFGIMKVVMMALGGPVTLIIAAIGALVGVFVVLWNKCEGFRNFFKGLWEGLKNIVSTAVNFIVKFFTQTIPNAISTMVNWFAQLPSRIWTWLTNTVTKVGQWVVNMVAKARELGMKFLNAILDFFKQLPYKIGYLLGYCIGKVIQFGKNLWTFATVTVPQFIGKVVQWFAQLPSKIWNWLVNTVKKVGQWGINMATKAVQIATDFINKVISFFQQLPSKIWNWLVQTVQKVAQWGKDLVSKGIEAATKLTESIVNGVKAIPGKMLEIGKNIVQGLWNGIKNAASWLWDKITGFCDGIIDGIAGALGINSPSKVMADLFKWVPVGAGEGILNNAKYAVKAVKEMGGKVTTAASKISPTIQTKVASASTKIKAFGKGGTVTSPQHAIVGDKPETIVPHGDTPRNRGLLNQAIKGVFGGKKNAGGTYNITFAPVVNGGDVNENKRMLEEEREKFRQMMREFFEEEGELAY